MRVFLASAAVAFVALASNGAIAVDLPPVFPPIDGEVRTQPRPFVASKIAHAAYEVHLRNLWSRRVTLERIEVHDGSTSEARRPLLSLEGAALDASMMRPGAPMDDPERRVLPPGRTAIVFIWVQAPPHAMPATLTHRLAVRLEGLEPQSARELPGAQQAPEARLEINGIDVPVSREAMPVLSAPLSGDLWLAGNGPDNSAGHRRAVMALRGEGRIAQRFAVDWVRLFPDGRTFRGDPADNRSYRAFGAEALAVAPATVVETKDGIPENTPDPVARAVPITPETIGGNFILLELDAGVYALYAHLQPGSLRVKAGDRVRRGQVLALVGNTGNSSEPHLHFQVADRRSAFDAEGIPYALASFDLQANPKDVTAALKQVGGSLAVDGSALGQWLAAPAHRRENEMPMMNAVVDFGQGRAR